MHHKSASSQRGARLARGHRLEKVSGAVGDVLISPAGAVQLNPTASRILALCDGTRTSEEIVIHVVGAAHGSREEDVRAFLDSALRRGWITGG
jgi:hypothetical protein